MKLQRLAEKLGQVSDKRRQWGHIRHKRVDILAIGFLHIVCEGEEFADMEDLGYGRP